MSSIETSSDLCSNGGTIACNIGLMGAPNVPKCPTKNLLLYWLRIRDTAAGSSAFGTLLGRGSQWKLVVAPSSKRFSIFSHDGVDIQTRRAARSKITVI